MNEEYKVIASVVSESQRDNRNDLVNLLRETPIPEAELLRNLGLFVNPSDLKKFLFINDLYERQMGLHGVVMEFGVRWGQNLSLFQSLRAIYEPYNYGRKIIGFDTWEGFPAVHQKDGSAKAITVGGYNVSKNYEIYLSKVLRNLEMESPLGHIQKFELVKGNAISELEKYLKAQPQTIISLAYFDMDIYEPTLRCLELIKPYLTKGSILAFDELNYAEFPGETVALREAFGLDRFKIQRSRYSHYQSFIVYE
jgi:hypothetical protein